MYTCQKMVLLLIFIIIAGIGEYLKLPIFLALGLTGFVMSLFWTIED